MKLTTTIEEVQYAASICLKCGCCTYGEWPDNHKLCSIFYPDQCFTNCGGGIMSILTALAENLLEYDSKIAELFYTCAGCLVCDSRCSVIKNHKPKAKMIDMIKLLRYEAVKKGLIPEGMTRELYDQLKSKGELGTPSNFKLNETIFNQDAETVLYIGSDHDGIQDEILEHTNSILAKIGSPVTSYNESGCCGSILYDYGLWDQLGPMMKANWEKMKPYKEKTVVFVDPHCQEFMTKQYPEDLPDYTPLNTQHITQLIAAAIKSGKIKENDSDKIKVSYHDPCYLGRGMGIYEAPREALTSLKNVELVEMKRIRENAYCCGARVAGNYHPDASANVAKERLDEFFETGADLLITACPYCSQNLKKALPDNLKDKVEDITGFIAGRVS